MVSRLKEVYNEGTCEFQYGFRVGRCVENAWSYVKRSVEKSTSKYVPNIFVNFRGAFDYLSWASVLRRLAETGCRELSIWSSNTHGRRTCIVSANDTIWKDVVRSCPDFWQKTMKVNKIAMKRFSKICL